MSLTHFNAAKPLSKYKVGMKVNVNDKMQQNYTYLLSEAIGKNFDVGFKPALSPSEMLKLGVFEGKYLNDCINEIPREWYLRAIDSLSLTQPNVDKNCFGIKSRQPLSTWRQKGWILPEDSDPRGWFQWYCRYYLGRRLPEVDQRQIKRWQNFKRHQAQVIKNCATNDFSCRPRQRQALLQWAYNPFI